ncbi:hypothetical protein ONE63_004932 [Megalurothrips usitatus]|uniref:Uncharacterized protein n=1 Tax=Megalurothrips usitatus TaxID=439358 RepID=A0AAV7X7S1_9NEOP|nr:hypothetical protein ONE63_004932 [Megalurothrips usitatus]
MSDCECDCGDCDCNCGDCDCNCCDCGGDGNCGGCDCFECSWSVCGALCDPEDGCCGDTGRDRSRKREKEEEEEEEERRRAARLEDEVMRRQPERTDLMASWRRASEPDKHADGPFVPDSVLVGLVPDPTAPPRQAAEDPQ